MIAIAPTGSGKTLAYLLPLAKFLIDAKSKKSNKKAIIIAPTFELSIQIYKVCLKLIGKKKPLGGIRIGILAKLLLAKKKAGEKIEPLKLFEDLGKIFFSQRLSNHFK